MKPTVLELYLYTLFIVACSPILLETAFVEPILSSEDKKPLTKSSLREQNSYSNEALLRHFTQTDHHLVLMHHVVFRDSLYVQTLTDDDMANLHITESEQAFSNSFVVSMNELLKRQE